MCKNEVKKIVMQPNLEGRIIRIVKNTDDQFILSLEKPEEGPKEETVYPTNELITLKELERRHIKFMLENSETLEIAAKRLGIDLSTLWRKRRKLKLQFYGPL